ncbi:hypothetical protein ACFLXJ_04610 [Chloroflexota bacterium]
MSGKRLITATELPPERHKTVSIDKRGVAKIVDHGVSRVRIMLHLIMAKKIGPVAIAEKWLKTGCAFRSLFGQKR